MTNQETNQADNLNWPQILEDLLAGKPLDFTNAKIVMTAILKGYVSEPRLAAFLTALRAKGVYPEEIYGFVSAMKDFALKVSINNPQNAVDTCGTGGDKVGTINVSTISAFVVAGAGAKVAKHGNRAASSLTGSADLLEELGVNIALPPDKVAICIEEIGIGFLFAPVFHPALKVAANVRKELGIRTVFNFLGPLANPAEVGRQIIGVSDPKMLDLIAQVLKISGITHAMVLHGAGGLDELSTLGQSEVREIKRNQRKEIEILSYKVDCREFGIPYTDLAQIKSGDRKSAAYATRAILSGEQGPKSDIVIFNSAAAMLVAGLVDKLSEGVKLAKEVLYSGKGLKKLDDLIQLSVKLGN
jgi:anthranilate phosphoribosyltransferase